MDSGSSSESFASFDDEEAYQKVEIINSTKVPEIDSSSAAYSPGKNLNSQRDDSSDRTEKLMDMKFTIKWVRLTIVMAFTALFAVLSISYITNNGKIQPETLFRQNPYSFIVFLMLLTVAFFSAINGVIFSEKFPTMSTAFSLVALVGVILSFTVLLWALLPPEYSLAPWIFFGFTFGSLLYLCGQQRQRN